MTTFFLAACAVLPIMAKADCKKCLVVAHRGFSAVAPENTLAAAARAIESGADGDECDVQATKDGELVLMHDDKLDRTTNGKGKLSDRTLAELKELDAGSWKDPRYANERIPTLAEWLAKHKNTNCEPVIEIKADGITRKVVETIREAGMIDRAVVIAFDSNVIKEVGSLEPRLRRAWVCGKELTGSPTQRTQWIADQARACGVNIVDLGHKMLSEEIIARLHAHGLTVWAWTVDEPAVLDCLMRWGIDGITTNRPDTAMERRRAMK
jgi:glycerophosphoryl diester phosphodiesterase